MSSVQRAAEDVSVRNIKAVIEHANTTRELTRNLEKSIEELKILVVQQNNEIDILKSQIRLLLIENFNGGAVGD